MQDNAGTNLGLRESVKGGESRTISLHAQLIERNRNNYTQLVQRHDGVDGQMNNFDEEYTVRALLLIPERCAGACLWVPKLQAHRQ